MTDLPPALQAFVLHAGQLAGRWGASRAAGCVFGLLFLSPRGLAAEEIARRLAMSRSGVSVALKELRGWHLVEARRVAGDRREHYAAPGDVATILGRLTQERRRREVDSTLALLEAGLIERGSSGEPFALGRLRALHRGLVAGRDNAFASLADGRRPVTGWAAE